MKGEKRRCVFLDEVGVRVQLGTDRELTEEERSALADLVRAIRRRVETATVGVPSPRQSEE